MLATSAELFLKYGCPVTSDLCKEFITVSSGILVFSLTMSQKMTSTWAANKTFRWLVGAAWGSLLFAIIGYGVALTYITRAGYHATEGDQFANFEQISYVWVAVGGTAFVIGLLALIAAAVMRVTVAGSDAPS